MIEEVIFTQKQNGDPLDANEWNNLTNLIEDIREAVNEGNIGGGGSTPSTPIDSSGMLSVSSKGNLTVGNNTIKNINLEPGYPKTDNNKYGDIALKPGDDILFCSHHREPKKRDKVVLKSIDGSDNPVKTLIMTGELEIVLGTEDNPKTATMKKDKTTGEDTQNPMFKPDDAKTLDVKILTGNILDKGGDNERDERGYLKVRAQAIDLRCEKHGGIALQPKGYDSNGNMNKIKFEHGGGDGLEFGTFNTEKTSIYTDEYRFKKDGIWKMATRETEASDKTIRDEGTIPNGKTATGSRKYVKLNDDFYDIINQNDPQTTTEAIIKTASALNNNRIKTGITSSNNFKISSTNTYKIVEIEYTPEAGETFNSFHITQFENLTKDDLKLITNSQSVKLSDYIGTDTVFQDNGGHYYVLQEETTPNISLESENKVILDAKGDVEVNSGDTIKMESPEIRMNAINSDKSGGTVNFGATQDIIFINNKLTKSLNVEAPNDPVKIKQVIQNNYSESVYWSNDLGKFVIPLKTLYIDSNLQTLLTKYNYANGIPVYFDDGSLVPANYCCFIGCSETVSDPNNQQQINYFKIYKIETKGSDAVLKKTLDEAVAIYTDVTFDLSTGHLINSTIELCNIKNTTFKFPSNNGSEDLSGLITVQAGEFVTLSEVEIGEIALLINYYKLNNMLPFDLAYQLNHQLPSRNVIKFPENLNINSITDAFNIISYIKGSYVDYLVNGTIVTAVLKEGYFGWLASGNAYRITYSSKNPVIGPSWTTLGYYWNYNSYYNSLSAGVGPANTAPMFTFTEIGVIQTQGKTS